ncbi:hypothetical protein [Alicyclobacillus pomorum]|uniref:hypothetical protein n=1 Tax=Alicyclobacillus pomorum TaxID=204470 RepID=UPI0004035547|nr:hypothetical protein [Alicyclobacillus pomorum]
MRTLKGYEAIQVAEQHNILLYDLENKKEVSPAEAREYIERRRDPDVFIVYDWPDTDEEAERIVLREYQKALLERQESEARIFDLSVALSGGLPIHEVAAEAAAKRLVEQGKLEIVETRDDGNIYRIPQVMYFKRSFLDELRHVVCHQCAHLDPEGPFHEICLMNLVQFIKDTDLNTTDIVEVRASRTPTRRSTRPVHPSISMEWLSKTALATRKKWKEVLKPMLTDGLQVDVAKRPQRPEQPTEPPVHVQPVEEHRPQDLFKRTKISKNELIQFLRTVEIVDENGEVGHLRQENQKLLEKLAMKQREVEEIEKQRAFAEKQYQEVQRDLDVLLEALQIAKKRAPSSPSSGHVIDATYESSYDDDARS